MNFSEAIQSGFNNYVNFNGRAQRSAFWFWVLFAFLAGLVLSVLDYAIFGSDSFSPLSTIFAIGTILPNLAVGARRLHDTGRSGWWQLLWFLPIIGFIILLIWFIQQGEAGTNRYGPNPLGGGLQPIRP
jgi:uncharacterized membrane protein YhaH (DUF805 family)